MSRSLASGTGEHSYELAAEIVSYCRQTHDLADYLSTMKTRINVRNLN